VTDLSKLPPKIAIGAVLALGSLIFVLAVLLYGASYLRNQPFMFLGKEFGFGASELINRTTELQSCRRETAEMQQMLIALKSEKSQLKDANTALNAQQQARDSQDAAMWFPVDDVLFKDDGTFSTGDGAREGRGKWRNSESELSLQFVDESYGEVVLSTNLAPPGNKIRVSTLNSVLIPMEKWQYKVSVRSFSYSREPLVRIERRPRV
jgi:hypothetical protein